MFTHMYSNKQHRSGGSKAAICLQRIRMFIHVCSDQTHRSEGGNMKICLIIYLFSMNCKMDCALTIKLTQNLFAPESPFNCDQPHSINYVYFQILIQFHSLCLILDP
jgi:hypothetical protein